MKSVYDYVDSKYGEVKPSEKLTKEGLGFWNKNRKPSTPSQTKVVEGMEGQGSGGVGGDVSDLDKKMAEYGWKTRTVEDEKGKSIFLINRNGKEVATIQVDKKGKYMIFDNAESTIMTGRGQLEKSAEKVASQYFFAQKLTDAEKQKPITNETNQPAVEGNKPTKASKEAEATEPPPPTAEPPIEPPKPPKKVDSEGMDDLDKLANNVPDSGEVAKYMSKDTRGT